MVRVHWTLDLQMGLIGFQCIVGQWRLDLQTFRPAATIPIRINSVSRGSTVLYTALSGYVFCLWSWRVKAIIIKLSTRGQSYTQVYLQSVLWVKCIGKITGWLQSLGKMKCKLHLYSVKYNICLGEYCRNTLLFRMNNHYLRKWPFLMLRNLCIILVIRLVLVGLAADWLEPKAKMQLL